jgi:hypothetical protein
VKREDTEENDKDDAIKAREVALANERAQRERADRFKDLEEEADSAVKVEAVKVRAAQNATAMAQIWAMREEVALGVAQTELEEVCSLCIFCCIFHVILQFLH